MQRGHGSHTGAKKARVIQWLRENRGVYPLSVIKEKTGVDLIEHDARVRQELEKNNAVVYDPNVQMIRYQAKHMVEGGNNLKGLANLLRDEPLGLPLDAVVDCYPGAAVDLEALCMSGDAVKVPNFETRTYMIYWRENQDLNIEVDQDIQRLWHNIHMPKTKVDLDAELNQMGHMSKQDLASEHLATVSNYGGLTSKKRRRTTKSKGRWRRGLTNTHMMNKEGYGWMKDINK